MKTGPSKPAKPAKPTPADILGLKTQKSSSTTQTNHSLEAEVQEYFSNPEYGSSIIEFWQVSF